MTTRERYQLLLVDFETSLKSLQNAVSEDISGYNATVQDLIKNGRIQKFEICSELGWKAGKLYIEIELGDVVASPKQVYRRLFASNLITETLLFSLLLMTDDRNLLSHVYKEESFSAVEQKLTEHYHSLLSLYSIIK